MEADEEYNRIEKALAKLYAQRDAEEAVMPVHVEPEEPSND